MSCCVDCIFFDTSDWTGKVQLSFYVKGYWWRIDLINEEWIRKTAAYATREPKKQNEEGYVYCDNSDEEEETEEEGDESGEE
tara:strand:- start:4688 stop:4933 length:246 start_codon:yes stop_codon:yes gene_type:complete